MKIVIGFGRFRENDLANKNANDSEGRSVENHDRGGEKKVEESPHGQTHCCRIRRKVKERKKKKNQATMISQAGQIENRTWRKTRM